MLKNYATSLIGIIGHYMVYYFEILLTTSNFPHPHHIPQMGSCYSK